MSVGVHSAETLSYLLRMAQHVSLRPSDPLLQDPALFLNTHTDEHTHKQTTVEMRNVESCAGARMFHTAGLGSERVGNKQRRETLEAQSFILRTSSRKSCFYLCPESRHLTEWNVVPQQQCLHSRRAPGRWLPDRGSHWRPRTPAAKRDTQLRSLMHKCNFFSVNTNLEFHSFTACPGLYALWGMTATTQFFLWFLTLFISDVQVHFFESA